MPRIVKRGPAEDDLGAVTVIEQNEATDTVTRWKFEVTAKTRQNIRRRKSRRAQKYGGGAEIIDNAGICAGETLILRSSLKIVSGRHVADGPQDVPEHVTQALRSEGATQVRA